MVLNKTRQQAEKLINNLNAKLSQEQGNSRGRWSKTSQPTSKIHFTKANDIG